MRYTAPIPPGVTVTPTHFTLDLANEELRASMLAAYCNLQNYLAYAGYDDVDPASTAALEMSKVLRDLNK